MTQKQIEQAAIKYCDDMWGSKSTTEQEAYIAGAESRQAEIEELDKELDIVHSCLTDLFERQYSNDGERTHRIQSCLSEIEKLKKQSK